MDTLLLKYACSFREIPLVTQAEALMLSVDKAIDHIKNIGYNLVHEANSVISTIGEQIEKPTEVATQIAATAACLFFGFLDGATTISCGCGGGGGDNDLPKKKDDEDDRQFASRCLMGAAHMRLSGRGMRRGR